MSLLIHSGYFYSVSSSPLLLRCAPDCSIDTMSHAVHAAAIQATVSERLAQGPYVATRVGFESATLRTQGTELTTEPSRPTDLRLPLPPCFACAILDALLSQPKCNTRRGSVRFRSVLWHRVGWSLYQSL